MTTPYSQNEKSTGLDALTDSTLTQSDLHIVGDVSDSGFAKTITQNLLEDYIANSTNFISEFFANSSVITEINTIAPSPLTTKGDLFTYSTLPARLPVGTDGQVLSSDSTQTTGLKWVTPASGGGGGVFSNGIASKNLADASTTQTIAHGLGVIPSKIRLSVAGTDAIASHSVSIGAYDGVNNNSVGNVQASTSYLEWNSSTYSIGLSSNGDVPASTGQTGIVTVDATNITITWTKHGSATGTYSFLWEATGGDGIFQKTVSISSSEIKALAATPKELIAAPGAGRAIVPLGITYSFTYGTVQYTLGNDIRTTFSTTTGNALDSGIGVGQIRAAANSITNCAQPFGNEDPIVANDSIILKNIGAEYATGDGTLKVFLIYKTITL